MFIIMRPKVSAKRTCKIRLEEKFAEKVTLPDECERISINCKSPIVNGSAMCTDVDKDKPDSMGSQEFQKSYDSEYRRAIRSLNGALPATMIGRGDEMQTLHQFISDHIEENKSGSIYISGCPGTGKTAAVDLLLNALQERQSLNVLHVNCTSLKNPLAVYTKIAQELISNEAVTRSGRKCCDAIIHHLKKTSRRITILVLDEIDQLNSTNHSVLYSIFEWPSVAKKCFLLIGISNTLNLTDRILPRLQSHCVYQPLLVHFKPYTKAQIIDIFTYRLREAGVLDLFSPSALQMLAAKVSAMSGDVRKALDFGRRLVETLQKDGGCADRLILASMENTGVRSDGILLNGNNHHPTEKKRKAVDLTDVMHVMNDVYGTSQTFLSDTADETHTNDCFPLQQKLIICALLLTLKQTKKGCDITVGRLHDIYRKMCTNKKFQALDQGEFINMCTHIETKGIIRLTGRQEKKLNKVRLQWDEDEVMAALQDKQLLASILHDQSCIKL